MSKKFSMHFQAIHIHTFTLTRKFEIPAYKNNEYLNWSKQYYSCYSAFLHLQQGKSVLLDVSIQIEFTAWPAKWRIALIGERKVVHSKVQK
jgi:hypothetical protein